MNYRHQSSDNWDEFRWEREIRRDERRINRYFQELPSCLDLPGEEEMIFDQIAAQGDLIPTSGTPENMRNWSYLNSNDEDEEFNAPERRDGQEIIDAEDDLATEWNLCAARSLELSDMAPALAINCAYAKLLARTADFLDAEQIGLKRCLGKRALNDLNDLCSYLFAAVEYRPGLKPLLHQQITELGKIRQLLLERLKVVQP